MWLKAALILPLVAVIPTLSEDGCGDGTETPTPTPDDTTPTGSDYEAFSQLLENMDAASSYEQREQLVNDFMYDTQYSGGFPIIEGDTVTFVYPAGALTGNIRVAGDFNAWDANEFVMEETSSYPLYYKTITIPNPRASRQLYKFVGTTAGNDSYIADPNARRFQWDDFGEYSLIFGGSEASHLERYPNFMSESLGNGRGVYVYVPQGYVDSAEDFPILYMHDGQNLFDPEAIWGGWGVDEVADGMIASEEIEPMLIVGLSNTYERMDEYTHTEEFLPAYGGTVGGDGAIYGAFLVDEIMPFINDRYQSSQERNDTGLLGSSLGGLISYYIGDLYPDTFRYVGGMSSTFGWGKINLENETVIEILASSAKQDQVFYLDSGGAAVGDCDNDTDGDGIWDDNTSAGDNYCETLQMKSVLESKGYVEGVDLFYEWAPGAEHNEAEWHERMDEALNAFSMR